MGLALKLLRRVLAVALLAGTVVVGTSSPASACTCGHEPDAAAYARADAVFTGVLVEVRTPADRGGYSSGDPERFVFDVDLVYKGAVHARQSVVTARAPATCGLDISGSGPFVVYARTMMSASIEGTDTMNALDGELLSNLCSGTRLLAAQDLPSEFGPGFEPVAGSSPIGPDKSWLSDTLLLIVIVGGVAVTAAALLFGTRRRWVRRTVHDG